MSVIVIRFFREFSAKKVVFKNYQVADLLVQLLDSRTGRKEFNYKIASLSDYSKDKTNRITVQGHGK